MAQSSQWLGSSVNKRHEPSVSPSAIHLISAPGRCPLTSREVSELHAHMFHSCFQRSIRVASMRYIFHIHVLLFKRKYFVNPAYIHWTVIIVVRTLFRCKTNNSTVKDLEWCFTSFLRGFLPIEIYYRELFNSYCSYKAKKKTVVFWLLCAVCTVTFLNVFWENSRWTVIVRMHKRLLVLTMVC